MTDYRNPDTFLDAWLQGVAIAGVQWFCITPADDERPVSKWNYRPDYDVIESSLGVLSTTEAVFLAAMYSFFNPAVGNKMLHQLGIGSPGELAATLDEKRLRVIADLLVSYEGW